MRAPAAVLGIVLCIVPAAAADILLPAGFTVGVYVTGEGFDSDPSRTSGEVYDLWPLYRIPRGARLTPETEPRYFHGPPLPNAQVAAIRGGRDLFVTAFDRTPRAALVSSSLGSSGSPG